MSTISYEVALVYLDDIIIFDKSFEEHLNRLDLVLGQLNDAALKMKFSECMYFRENSFPGTYLSNKGVELDVEKIAGVSKIKNAKTIKELQAILGLIGK